MQHDSTPMSGSDLSQSVQDAQLEDLHQRIETLEALDESEFGEFTRRDWVVCIIFSIVIPTLLLVWIGR